ncbi:phosphotransferase enzyme family protein [Nonomuraea sp. SYSU D8015]|uniref:phosphotransferase enzyme family protein n=1 Tax=Nonomuraea sp. SYSU D8015 TaxID=2593644 RepID=UPI001660145E|nr:aminoglycoside phosphotransferase family protein [Nonomuraea sp. SYSU D8015]
MTAAGGTQSFNAEAALHALTLACADLGLNRSGATRLGPVGDNATFLLPSEHVVARVAWGSAALDRVKRELRVSAWLAAQGVPAVRVAAVPGQPVTADGRIITFWEEIPSAQQASTREMGALLRRLHALPPPPDGMLPPFNPFIRQQAHVDQAVNLSEADRHFLLDLIAELKAAYARLRFHHPAKAIHGDPHRKNLVRDANGTTLMLDLERFSVGPPEWDAIIPAVYHRIGWYTADEVAAFTAAYGWDVTTWDGFATLARVRQLRMTTWLAGRTGREPRLLPEVRLRIATLRDPSVARTWTPGT